MNTETSDFFQDSFTFDDKNTDEVLKNENSFFEFLRITNERYIDSLLSMDSEFYETLDIAKANSRISTSKNLELPLYLKNFLDMSSPKESQADSIILKLSKEGIKIIGNFFQNSIIAPVLIPDVSVRNQSFLSNQSVALLESVENGQILYQLLQETDTEVYLSLKLNAIQAKEYNQAVLKKDNRFIYSNSINSDGQISFSGLKQGLYNIELIGKTNTKRFDLTVCSE